MELHTPVMDAIVLAMGVIALICIAVTFWRSREGWNIPLADLDMPIDIDFTPF